MVSARTRASRRTFARRMKRHVRRKRRTGPKITKLLKKKTTASIKYVDVVSINAAAAGINNHVFRANSVFDPDSTGAGHQPLLFDEYAALYNQYRVISSKITVTPVTASSASKCFWGVYLDADSTLTYASGTSIIEDKRVSNWSVYASTNLTTNPAGKQNALKLHKSFNARRFLPKGGADDSFVVTTNPGSTANTAFYQLWVSSILASDPDSMDFLVEITYVVEFTAPVVVAQS